LIMSPVSASDPAADPGCAVRSHLRFGIPGSVPSRCVKTAEALF
jgi:hypothetical protein